MDVLLKELSGIFKFFEDLFLGIQKLLQPPKAFSWQTLIYLSVFSWILSYFATDLIKTLIAFCGWLFLILGTIWYTTDDPLRVPGTFMPVGAVVTGFLLSVFAFGHGVQVITPRTLVIWPIIAALITAIPEFLEGTGTEAKAQIPKPEVRQKIIILVGCCMLLSCWIQFYFVLDKWLTEYPTLLADKDNFQHSTFVIKIESPNKVPQNGLMLLNEIQPLVEEQIASKPWSQVERWLLDAHQRVDKLGKRVVEKNMIKSGEQKLWRIEPRIFNNKSGYRLDILSIWAGPSANASKYYLKRSCQIEPVKDKNSTVAEITCDPYSKLIYGLPPARQ